MNPLTTLLAQHAAGHLAKPAFIEQMFALHQLLPAYADRLTQTTIDRIEIRRGEVVAVLDDGLQLVIDPVDRRSIPLEILHWGDFEPIERSILLEMVQPGDTFLDIGGNVGWYSMVATRTHADLTVHCFEPVPATYARLMRHFELNGVRGVEVHPFGLSDAAGEATFFFDPAMTGNASGKDLSGAPGVLRVDVELSTMDAFTRQRELTVDAIKCDVEGAELKVLQGGLRTLERDRPAVMLELLRKWSAPYGYHPNDALGLMRGIGYQVFVAHEPGRLVPFGEVDDDTLETNYFFLHPDRHADRIARLVGA